MISFFCNNCKLDFDADGFINKNFYAEWFETKCPKCHKKTIRYITEKHKDPYFHESVKLKKERTKYKNDLIQYGERGFKMLYPKAWEQIEKEKEMKENKNKERKNTRDNLYKRFGWNPEYKKSLNKLYDEEAID